MTIFGWILVAILVLATVAPDIKPLYRLANVLLLMGVFVWGTGSL